jgi:hypothetical protein
MSKRDENTWVWVVIENPDKDENIVGQKDEKSGISFIPTFDGKENGLQCVNLLAREPGKIYEPQAILYGDLVTYAKENGFVIFFLDGLGKVLEQIKV